MLPWTWCGVQDYVIISPGTLSSSWDEMDWFVNFTNSACFIVPCNSGLNLALYHAYLHTCAFCCKGVKPVLFCASTVLPFTSAHVTRVLYIGNFTSSSHVIYSSVPSISSLSLFESLLVRVCERGRVGVLVLERIKSSPEPYCKWRALLSHIFSSLLKRAC